MARMPFPCVIEDAEKGAVRPRCEANGIELTPREFIGGQADYIVELDTPAKREAFERRWLS
jgi:hypothetical protein